jgi:23S rRNA pseudouridine1911/1915/1917 synthase
MEKVFEREVSEKMRGTRLDQYLVSGGIGISRNQAEKLIREGVVRVNDAPSKPSYKVKPGDRIFAKFMVDEKPEVVVQDFPIPIVYEDDDVVVINKPADMVVHPAKGNVKNTVINALLGRYRLPSTGNKARPGIVHRIDKDTTGLMVVAKTDTAVRSLGRQMEEKKAKRTYLTAVWGSLPQEEGEIQAPIGRHSIDRKRMAVTPFRSKPAWTDYKVMERFERLATLVQVKLRTGRTHQIRVHFEYLGYPVIGDKVYSGRTTRKILQKVPPEHAEHVGKILEIMERQALHAHRLAFIHPRKGVPLEVEAPIPEDLSNLITYLRGI